MTGWTMDEIVLCPNAHRNVHELLRAYRKYNGIPPWSIRRLYSTFIQQLAVRGWKASQQKGIQ